MAGKPIPVIAVGKWSVAHNKETDHTLLMFKFAKRPAINLVIKRADALAIAEAIQDQLTKPRIRSRMN